MTSVGRGARGEVRRRSRRGHTQVAARVAPTGPAADPRGRSIPVMRSNPRAPRWAGWTAALFGVEYAVSKVVMATRGELGVVGHPAPREVTESFSGDVVVAQLGNAGLGVLMVALALALVHRWGRRIPSALLAAGAVASVGCGIAGMAVVVASLTGVREDHGQWGVDSLVLGAVPLVAWVVLAGAALRAVRLPRLAPGRPRRGRRLPALRRHEAELGARRRAPHAPVAARRGRDARHARARAVHGRRPLDLRRARRRRRRRGDRHRAGVRPPAQPGPVARPHRRRAHGPPGQLRRGDRPRGPGRSARRRDPDRDVGPAALVAVLRRVGRHVARGRGGTSAAQAG